ncbi:hypothetical protein [Pseudomonas aeruginosa]|uniref:hypothetical protein n=1 Tax=Pseudomonas aeruginosa TaxID=287 RepID=UPI000FED9202|nr:hypothetical protein [Pseudomonas aeruginosa]MBM7166112.1 hypothetical protein [Pseudomonas aeruginosa]RQH30509.1 hypothetical protein IPC106_29420 [Pseudomonas aeruginosa]HCR1674449.1 hypothetical protein [Pseudomonas aeruginosa]
MSFIPSPSKSGGRTEADATPQAMGLAMNGYEIRNALEFLAPERTPEQMSHRLVIELHSESQEIRCPESGLYARHERLPEDIAIYLVDHEPAQVLPTQGMAPYDKDDLDADDQPRHVPSLVLNGYQLLNAIEFLAPDNTPEQFEQTLVIELHEQDEDFPVAGLYAYHDECPEEGAILLLDHQEGVPAGGGQEDTYETKIAKTLELVKQAADAIQVFTGHDSSANLRHHYGEKWWEKLDDLRDKLRAIGKSLPLAHSDQLLALDKQCRDDVGRALGLIPSEDRGFAWSYLLAAIKKVVGSHVLSSIKTAVEQAGAHEAVQDQRPSDWSCFNPTFVIEYLRESSTFDADLIGKMLEYATRPVEAGQASPSPVLGCDYRGKHFGAPYLDAQCQNGYLWDEDSCDEPGGPLLNGGDIPCPKCNAAEYAEYLRLDEDDNTSPVPVGDIELARKLFEEMALIADDEKCIHMLAGALSKAQPLAPRDDILSRMIELESVAKEGRPKKIVVRLKHPDSEPTGCSSLLNYHEPTRQQLITAGIPLSRHTRNPIVSFGMIGCKTTADGVIEYTWGESQEVLLDKSIPTVDMTRPAWLIPELKPDVVGALLLGGISGSEYGDNDIQVDSKVVERLQAERVTTEDDVVVELVTADQYKRDVAGLQARVDLFDRLAVANKALADSFQAERDTALASQAAQVRVIPANWKIERTGERIIVQHLHNGAGYAASRAGESGIAEAVLFLLASDLVGDGVVAQEDEA